MKRRLPAASPASDLAGALHEVSNALTVVLGWLGEARTKLPPGPEREAIDVAYSHAHRGHSVARRAIRGEDELSVVRSSSSVIDDALSAAGREAATRGVTLAREDAETDASIDGSDAVLQVLVNLLLNAIAFSPGGGVVRLSPRIADGRITFRVVDEGPGVPEGQRPSLFVRGQSLRPGGAGIGLSHSHALAEKHGGALRLIPSPKGAAFELEWPVSDAPSRTSQRVPAESLNGMRVLVLEDDPAVLTMIQLGLATRGVEVLPAAAMGDVRALIKAGNDYDAVFADMSPIQDDPDAALRVLRRGDRKLPVILISGSATAPGDDLPLSGWVHKPFQIADLCEALLKVSSSV